ncbi:MAG: FAD:protein FMN transferase [Alphaproteobacteria bacterium]
MFPPEDPNAIDWKKLFSIRNIVIWIVIIVIGVYWATRPNFEQYRFKGKTMGTTYLVKYWADTEIAPRRINTLVDRKLKQINNEISTWDKTSKIVEFNNTNKTGWFSVNKFFAQMVMMATNICYQTNGRFDITIKPLIDVWGFDVDGRVVKAPTNKQLKGVEKVIGCDKIATNISKKTIKKNSPNVSINLSAIAKGGAVDEIGKLMEAEGIENYLVEIGGEIRVRGKKIDGTNWLIGVEQPVRSSKKVNIILKLENESMATSGDYKNYFEENGVRYSHIIDPKTKMPIKHNLASVTVVTSSTAMADALATGLFVMGEKKALKFATKNNLKVYMIVRRDGVFETIASPAWEKHFGN